MAVVYLLIGVQGSGKSTWAAANARRLEAVGLASDDIREELVASGRGAEAAIGDVVFAIFNERLAGLLSQGRTVISDATHARRAWREKELAIARRAGAKIIGVWFDLPVEVCLRRNAGRGSGGWGRRIVPEAELRAVAKGFEAPVDGEFDEVWRIDL